MKEKEKTSIVTVVSLEPCSKCERWIVMQRIDSSTVELIPLVGVTQAGINAIRTHGWKWILKHSGPWETEANGEIGDECTKDKS